MFTNSLSLREYEVLLDSGAATLLCAVKDQHLFPSTNLRWSFYDGLSRLKNVLQLHQSKT